MTPGEMYRGKERVADAQVTAALHRALEALHELAQGDVPGEGDWADCMVEFAESEWLAVRALLWGDG